MTSRNTRGGGLTSRPGADRGAAAHRDIFVIPGLTRNPPWIRRLDTGFRQYDGMGQTGGSAAHGMIGNMAPCLADAIV